MPEKFPSSPEIETSEDREKREDAEQDFTESRATELFFNSSIDPLPNITPERKAAIHEYIQKNPGQWRHVDGQDIIVSDVRVEPNRIIFTLEAYGQEIEDEIPV